MGKKAVILKSPTAEEMKEGEAQTRERGGEEKRKVFCHYVFT